MGYGKHNESNRWDHGRRGGPQTSRPANRRPLQDRTASGALACPVAIFSRPVFGQDRRRRTSLHLPRPRRAGVSASIFTPSNIRSSGSKTRTGQRLLPNPLPSARPARRIRRTGRITTRRRSMRVATFRNCSRSFAATSTRRWKINQRAVVRHSHWPMRSMRSCKVYSTHSGRRFVNDLSEAKDKGYIAKMPHYNTIFKFIENAGSPRFSWR